MVEMGFCGFIKWFFWDGLVFVCLLLFEGGFIILVFCLEVVFVFRFMLEEY